LRLFSRNYCHPCHAMLAALEAKYNERVPVLVDGEGRELCHYFLDVAKVREYLSAFRQESLFAVSPAPTFTRPM